MTNLTVPKIRSIQSQVYEGIKSLIIKGQFPQDSKLQESDLAELFHVSRTPVREALKALKDDGLLEIRGKGYYVKVLTPRNVDDIFQIRALLEDYALRIAIPLMDQEQVRFLMELRARFERFRTYEDLEEYIRLDCQLHDTIISYSCNQFLVDLLNRLTTILQPVRVFSLSSPQRYEESILEHICIIDGMVSRDIETAAGTLRIHLERARQEVLHVLEQQATSTEPPTEESK